MVFERKKYLDELIAGRGNGLVKIITGVRRYGKSFLLFYIWHNWCWSKVNHQCRLNDYMNCLKSFFSNCHKKRTFKRRHDCVLRKGVNFYNTYRLRLCHYYTDNF